MRLLLDTHVFLWWIVDAPLASQAEQAIADPTNDVLVSAATVWEIAIKRANDQLRLDFDVRQAVEDVGMSLLSMSAEHADRAGSLPAHHRDPFDRMLVAQAQMEQLALVTRDQAMSAYNVPLLLA